MPSDGAVRVLVTGATGFTGGHLARRSPRAAIAVRALVRDAARGARGAAGIELGGRRLTDARVARRAPSRRRRRLPHRGALSAGRASTTARYRAVNATAVGTLDRSGRRGRRAARRALQHRRRARRHRASAGRRRRAAAARRHLSGDQARRGERGARGRGRTGVEVVIARPTGIYGPGDRRLLKLFRGVARRRFVVLGRGRDLLSPDLHRRSGRRVPAVRRSARRAAGRTYILAGAEVTTLNELVAITAEAPAWRRRAAPAGVAVLAGRRRLRGGLRAARHRAADLSPPRRLLHQEPRVRHRRAPRRDRLRAARSGCARASAGTLAWYRRGTEWL